MFDFDVVTGPGDLAKPVRPDARRKQELPPEAAAPKIGTSAEMKLKSAGDGDRPQPHLE
jgi:hypothetical protein